MLIRRHTPLVLLAMLVAAASVSLLLLPASGQTFDKTEGKTGSGGFSVGVFAGIADAQLAKNVFNSTYNTYVPTNQTPVALSSGITNPGAHTMGDTAYLANPEVQPQYTFFDGTLYVSNDPEAHNTILITAVASEVTPNIDGCVEATVRSGRDTITVQMPTTADTGGNTFYQAFVRVLDPRAELPQGTPDYESSDGPDCVEDTSVTPSPPYYDTDGVGRTEIASILGRHGDTVTISIAGAGQVSLEVDGEGPDLDEITPEHDSAWRSGRLDFSFEVRDDDSGLRHDGELVRSADGDDTQVNGDRDQVTSGEPLTERSPGQIAVNGKAADISLRVGSMSDITDIGRWTLLGSRPGVAYEFSARGNNFDEGRYVMEVTARDRAGNETMSVGWYDDDDMPQPYTFTIDDTEPSVRAVQAGVGYDTREEKEVPDRKSIMVDFGEALRSGIDHEQFTVSGHRVVGIVHPGRLSGDEMAMDIEGNPIDDPRSRIYLQLADELASDETPDVLLFGGIVYDLAGNSNDSVDRTAEDIVAPLFRVGLAALAEGATLTPGPLPAREEGKGRLVANGDGEFVVDVRSDEEVRRRPTVYFVGIDTVEGTKNGTKTGKYVYSIRSVQTGGALVEQEDPLHWRRAYEASRLTSLGGLIGVIVSAEDENRNVFSTPGWKPASRQDNPSDDDVLDVEAMDKAGLLLELDTDFNDDATPELRVTPRRGQEDDETESARPIVAMLFSAEGEEYALCPSGTNGGCGGDNPDAEFSDSHAKVYITEITLNGGDASARLSRVDDAQFALQAGNLAQGRHEVAYKAVDEAGNEAEGEFAFSVVARGAYEIDISPGWNLISVPGTPVDPSLNAVIPPSGGISAVMSYQESNWLTAAVGEDGSWRGSLTEIEAGYGYWVYATSFATVAPLIPEPETTSLPPTVRVNHGWNLLGVIDLFQNAAGKAPGAGDGDGEADNYFGSFDWRVAYTFDGQYHRWVRIAPEDDKDDEEEDDDEPPEIVNGRGYWVWSAEPGTLVP
ncbi:MAG: hypothetical protein F4X54_11860 [Chloroflexi bacterium]|nr:hypothetical protein [Chloroflexota bacterium]